MNPAWGVAGAPEEGGLAGFSAEQVEEVHAVVRMLPIFFTTVLYWTIYAQVRPVYLFAFRPDTLVQRHCRS